MNARDVALYLLSKDGDRTLFNTKLMNRNGRTFYEGNARLNKYLQLAQNIYIAMYEKKLFSDDIIAYDNGGVVLDVQNNYSNLLKTKEKYSIESDSVKSYLDKLYFILKDATVDELIELSHEDDAWKEKSNKYLYADEIMDSLEYKEAYKKQYAGVIELLKVSDEWMN